MTERDESGPRQPQPQPRSRPGASRRHWLKAARQLSVLAVVGAGLQVLAGSARAADWPARTVRLVVPFAAGGATDSLGRALAAELTQAWKQTVIVDNRPGAGGGLGADAVAKSPADGYTLLLASGSMFTVNPFIYRKLPYSAQSFEKITKVASGPMVVTVNADVPAKSMRELIALAKAQPGKLTFASAGIGSQVHMAGEAFADAAGIEIVHVPYKGEGPAYSDLMGGQISMAVANINAISPLLKGGRVRALATTGKERAALLPDVPTAAEAGLAGFEFTGWFAVMAPAGTRKEITERVYAAVQAALKQPDMKRYLADQGMTAGLSAPGQLDDDIAVESRRWSALVKRRRIDAN